MDNETRKKKILVVDDEPNNLKMMVRNLRKKYEVLTASNGKEALERLNQQFVELVLLDWMMPDMDGLNTFKEIKELPGAPPVIMVTAHSTTRLATEAIKEGFADFVEKPVDFDSLVFKMEKAIKNAELQKKMKAMELALLHAQKSETVGMLSSGIANELNNIITPALIYLDLSLEDEENQEIRINLEGARKAINRVKELAQQILIFGRHDNQEKKLLKAQTVIKEELDLLKTILPGSVDIVQRLDDTLEPILINTVHIHQIIMNLCMNAADAMGNQGKIEVGLEEIEINNDPLLDQGIYLKLSVKDNGHGMDQKTAEQIFNPFFTTKQSGKGTGLGLCIVHGIVSAYGGKIDVQTSPGKGTIFLVYLPRTNRFAPATDVSVYREPNFSGNERILFIDDAKTLIDLAKPMLERFGYHITSRSSIEALEHFRSQPDKFDLVITHQAASSGTGIDLAKGIKSIKKDIPVILCLDKDAKRALGIDEIIDKKSSMATILKKVRQLLDGKRERGGE